MPVPTSADDLVALIRRSGLLEPARLDAYFTLHPNGVHSSTELAAKMQADGLLTPFHVEQLLKGKHRGYFLGKYRLIDRIGLGGMGQVFLAEHVSMRRRVAIKVLPPERTDSAYSRERFLREARAAGQLDHPNLVRAFDVDQEGEVWFLVMEFVDGVSFHDLVTRFGPLPANRAGYYLWQAAHGLAYLYSCSLIHRDIKPANLLVDRQGVVKILDLGLVRSHVSNDDLTRQEGVKILGTADYLAPEQAIDCTTVDFRADVYGLGATAYFLLTAQPPFPAEKVAQKLIAHQVKVAKPVHLVRSDVPVEFSAVIARMMAKKPGDRYESPEELLDVLAPWAQDPPPPPSEQEIPAFVGGVYGSPGTVSLGAPRTGRGSSVSGTGVGSGSAIRYHGDSHMPLRPTGQTPFPKPLSTPKPVAAIKNVTPRPASILPPILPALATHGSAVTELGKAEDSRVAEPGAIRFPKWNAIVPSKPQPQPQPQPQPESVILLNPVTRSRRRLLMGLALALILAIGTWDAVVLSRASVRPSASPSAPTDTGPAVEQPGEPGAIRAGL